MTPAAFHLTLSQKTPPCALGVPLKALWWARKGNWDKAHGIVMDQASPEAAWVHAYLHRVDGDLGNASYWYRQAQKPAASGDLDAEWTAMVHALLAGG